MGSSDIDSDAGGTADDGNFGATSGITEMLLQSHLRDKSGDYFLDILPTLPTALPKGKITGLRARGAFEIDIEWDNGKLVSVGVKSLKGNNLNLRYRGYVIAKTTMQGENHIYKITDFSPND